MVKKSWLLGLLMLNSLASATDRPNANVSLGKFLAFTVGVVAILALRKVGATPACVESKVLDRTVLSSNGRIGLYSKDLASAFGKFCRYGLSQGGRLWRAFTNNKG